MAKLIRDLRRPAARLEASEILRSRIPADEPQLRYWVERQLDDGAVTALSVWSRADMTDSDVIAGWRDAARRDAENDDSGLTTGYGL